MTWTTTRPTKPGEYWLSLPPVSRAIVGCAAVRAVVVHYADAERVKLYVFINNIESWPVEHSYWDGAQWAERSVPADPFAISHHHVWLHKSKHQQRCKHCGQVRRWNGTRWLYRRQGQLVRQRPECKRQP